MRVLICGGRNYNNHHMAYNIFNHYHIIWDGITEVIEGGATGGDRLGRNWANSKGIPVTTVNAEWSKYGRSAGYKRNVKMAELKPDKIIALPGGVGTQHMIDIGTKYGIPIIIVSE